MADQPSERPAPGEQLANAVKLAANLAIIPGTSQLVEGNVREGLVYGLAGVASKVVSPLLGPLWWVPWVGVALDSFSRSASGRHLWQLGPTKTEAPAPPEQGSIAP
jgi:hypothetical protein